MFTPVPPDIDFVALEQAELARWSAHRVFERSIEQREGAAALGLLRGPADGQRHAGPAPRLGPGLQGPLLPLPHHGRRLRGPPGRLGHPRAAGRGRGGEEARHHGQGADRGAGRHRRVHPAVPRVRLLLRRRVRPPDDAHRLLGRHGRGVLDVGPDVHRVGLVAPAAALRPGAPVRGPQGRAVLPPLRDGAVEPRARPARRLPGRGGRVGLRAPAPGRPARPTSVGGRRRRVAGRVDDHAVDPAVEHGRGRQPRPHVRRRRRGGDGRRRWWTRSWGRGRRPGSRPRVPGSALVGLHYERPFDDLDAPHGRRRVAGGAGVVRDDRGGHRARAPGAGLRRGRPPDRPGERPALAEPGRARRPLHRRRRVAGRA